MELTFSEVNSLLSMLETQSNNFSILMGMPIEDRRNIITSNNKAFGMPELDGDEFTDEAFSNLIAGKYNTINVIIEKLKAVLRHDSSWLITVLFPYRNLHSTDIKEKADQAKIDEKRKFIVDFLNSDEYTSKEEYEGNVFLFGYKSVKKKAILIYECRDWTRHDFILADIPK